jgi:cyclic beta-1,2-glucan synthetase
MYRAAIEAFLGLRRHGTTFSVNPCIPAIWPEYALEWRVGDTHYQVTVTNPHHQSSGIASVTLDGAPVDPLLIPIDEDGARHEVSVVLGRPVTLQPVPQAAHELKS